MLKDTSVLMEKKMQELASQKSGVEKLRMSFSMYEFSRGLIEAAITRQFPHLTDREKRQKIFMTYYADNLAPEVQKKILEWL